MTIQTQVRCPKCHHEFSPSDSIRERLIEEEKAKLQIDFENKEKELSDANKLLAKKKQEIEMEQANLVIENKELKESRDSEIKKRVSEEVKIQIPEIRKEIEMEAEKKVQQAEGAKYSREMSIKDEKIRQLENQIAGIQRYGPSTSQQVQGQSFQSWVTNELKKLFETDQIKSFGRAEKGPDVLQTIMVSNMPVGRIVWEAKDTKEFNSEWIEKVKREREEFNATAAIICSSALPKEIRDTGRMFGRIKDVTIIHPDILCSTAFFVRKAISDISRNNALKENQVSQEGKVYSYVSSDHFKNRMMGIAEVWISQDANLRKDRNTFENQFAKRQRDNAKLYSCMLGIRNDFEGISLNSQIKAIDGLDATLQLK